jgi:hypothetical protein
MDEQPDIPILDEIDHLILMHRDAHFSGSFSFMLDYYEKEGKGIQPEVEVERIEQLALIEKELNLNLAAVTLTPEEIFQVAASRKAYAGFQALYEKEETLSPTRLVSDLILSEDLDEESAINTLVSAGNKTTPLLIELVQSDRLRNPLYPGYGEAPRLAAQALGKMKAESAIPTLFQLIGKGDFFFEETLLDSLHAIGPKSKEFLIHALKARPFTEDNERAAVALIRFREEDPEVDALFKEQLKDPTLPKRLRTHLTEE